MTGEYQGCSRILVVDDSRMFRNVIKDCLSGVDCKIVEADNGETGLFLASQHVFDLVITDVDMPGTNGIDMCRQLKADPGTSALPILMISTFDSEKDIHNGFQAGASAYLSKNEPLSRMLSTIEGLLSKSRFNGSKLILVVDDSAMIRNMVRLELVKSGYQVADAQNGAQALEILNIRQPDLILSDIDMPVMNGFELCEAVQRDKRFAAIPFVVMSSNGDRGHMHRMLNRGCLAYLVKPFSMDQLSILVDNMLSTQYQMLLKDRERLESEQQIMLSSITSLVTALEARDAYTRGHSHEVARIAASLARFSGASDQEARQVYIGGHLHDIGKIGVSDAILLKPDRLSAREFDCIKKHPEIGANILSPIERLADMIPMVRYHHERMDGKGYPDGLKGDAIPLWARITAVADTFHALTSDRPYRTGMKPDNAQEILKDARGIQLCPDCVDLFFDWFGQGDNRDNFTSAGLDHQIAWGRSPLVSIA